YYNYINLPFNVLYLKVSSLKLYLISISIPLFLFSTITIAQAPVADFSADKVSGCSPLTVTFTDHSTTLHHGFGILVMGNYNLCKIQPLIFLHPVLIL